MMIKITTSTPPPMYIQNSSGLAGRPRSVSSRCKEYYIRILSVMPVTVACSLPRHYKINVCDPQTEKDRDYFPVLISLHSLLRP